MANRSVLRRRASGIVVDVDERRGRRIVRVGAELVFLDVEQQITVGISAPVARVVRIEPVVDLPLIGNAIAVGIAIENIGC